MGQKLMTFVDAHGRSPTPKTFRIVLKEPTGLVLAALGKPSSNVPFIMPKRVAETDPEQADRGLHRLGPVRLQARRVEARRQGGLREVRQVQAAHRAAVGHRRRQGRQRRPRRVASRSRDQQQAVNALLAGEIDIIEPPSHDLLPLLKADKNVKLVDWNPLGNQYMFRFNHLHKPFDNPKIRQARLVRVQPGGLPEGGRSATRATTRPARRCSSAARRSRPKPAWRACSSRTSRRRRSC